MPLQRTFTLIEPGPSARPPAEPSRPMTSKQVRKAYQAATRAAPISRAERHRQERADQDAIRRDLARRDAAARARHAHDRRRERLLSEREDRRRKRLPLAPVPPSQDTIARFVRPPPPPPTAGPEAVGEDAGEVDLIPDEDELDLDALEQLETAVCAVGKDGQAGTAPSSPSASPSSSSSTSGRSPTDQPRPPTAYELDLGLVAHPRPDKQTPPPPCTQAILSNLADLFPSPSQQERELRDETVPTPSPRRFLTASSDRALVALALQRSRRSAARDDLRQRDRAPPPDDALPPAKALSCRADKENVAPTPACRAPSASQETEYGGDWVDETAVELAI